MQSWKVKDDEDCIVGLVFFSENPKRWHVFFQNGCNNNSTTGCWKDFSKKKGAPVLMKQDTSLAFSICSSLIRWSSASRRASRACNLLKECLARVINTIMPTFTTLSRYLNNLNQKVEENQIKFGTLISNCLFCRRVVLVSPQWLGASELKKKSIKSPKVFPPQKNPQAWRVQAPRTFNIDAWREESSFRSQSIHRRFGQFDFIQKSGPEQDHFLYTTCHFPQNCDDVKKSCFSNTNGEIH